MSLTSAQYMKDRLEKILSKPDKFLDVSISINRLAVGFDLTREQASQLSLRLQWRLEELGLDLFGLIRKAPSNETAPTSQ